MADIEVINRPVYLARTKGRCYLSPKSAANAEARAMLAAKYPTERQIQDEFGRIEDPGYHWSSDERLQKVYGRLSRLILRKFKQSAKRKPHP